ncbi:MAG TPA: RDD family protein, partial [Longimicrobium sp.]|nr:RDD family protein [Longimicrobium sp.]
MATPTTSPGIDPRKRITPENFSVAPHLLGLPLASPMRRLAAILLDLCLVAVLANLGGKVLFAGLVGASFFWFAGRKLGKGGTFFSRSARAAMRGVGALFLFIAAAALFGRAESGVQQAVVGDDGPAQPAAVVATTPRHGLAAMRMAKSLVAVQNATDSAHAFSAARAAVAQMRRLGMTDAQIRDALRDAAAEEEDAKPYVAAAYHAAMPAAAPGDSAAEKEDLPRDSLASLYAAAVRDDDSTRAEALRPRLASALARDSLDELREQVSRLENDKRELTDQVKKEEKKGLLGTLLGFLDDLGIGFGWIGLYFTAFTALWKGQTPGKKLFGIRVLRLDGLPMTLWASFERFGGYAAGLFTGLMGYAQVFWDRNRQAIQDKISETVVIRQPAGV